jgi:hypothetical protein
MSEEEAASTILIGPRNWSSAKEIVYFNILCIKKRFQMKLHWLPKKFCSSSEACNGKSNVLDGDIVASLQDLIY